MNNAINVALGFLVLSQIIVIYKVFRISAKLEKRRSFKSGSDFNRKGEDRTDSRNRNDRNQNRNRTPGQPNQNQNQNRNVPKPVQKPQPAQKPVSAVDKSLREINMRLKDAEREQEKTREKLSGEPTNLSERKERPAPSNDNYSRQGSKIKRRSENFQKKAPDSTIVVEKASVDADSISGESRAFESESSNESRIKRRNLEEKPEVTIDTAVEVASTTFSETVAPVVSEVVVKSEPVQESLPQQQDQEEFTYGRR